MAASPATKSAPSSPETSKGSVSTPKRIGQTLSGWPRRIQTRCRQWTWPLYRARLQHSRHPILVGPFLGEVGLETLYWQPFVDQFVTACGIDRSRLIPISRSGAAHWYGYPTGIELYAMRTVQDVRIDNKVRVAQTGMLKQATVSRFDREVWRDVAQTLNLKSYHTLHPAWMYQTLAPFWGAQTGLMWLEGRTRYAPLPVPPVDLKLPERFVAVKFYARPTWPPSATTANIARETITQIASHVPVVLLNTDLPMDDHVDFVPKPLPANVIKLTDLVTVEPQTSLAVMSAVMAKATGFVGTYGGMSHLALRYGKPSLNLYAEWQGASVAHKHLSEALALKIGLPFIVVKLHDVPMIQDCLPRIVATEKPVAPQPQMV